jgi:hypothetical protein
VPSLFRRRSTELLADPPEPPTAGPQAPPGPATAGTPGPAEPATAGPPDAAGPAPEARSRGYTPSKKELGVATPKRPSAHLRRPGATPAARSRKDLTKEERRELREERRQRRREDTEGMRRGDERYLSGRDRGPVRALARDVVDSRRTVGTFFFAGALIVLLGSSATMPAQVRLVANLLWAVLAVAVLLDITLLCRKVKRLVRERFPDSTERMGGLYLYVAMRSITFRKLRIPLPRLKRGDAV